MKIFDRVKSEDGSPTTNDLSSAKLTAGQIVRTKGYFTPGDGGGADYLIAASQPVDNDVDHDLANGNVALYQAPQTVTNKSIGGTQDTGGLNVVGCAVRIVPQTAPTDNTFQFVDDAEHDPINCTDVTGSLNTISVTHEKPAGSEVVGTCVIVPDETLAQRGIIAGGSIATGVSVVTLTKRHQFLVDWEQAALDVNNAIVDPFMDTSQRYIVTNNTGTTGGYQIVAPRTTDGYRTINPVSNTAPDGWINNLSDTTFDVFPYKDITFQARYNGSTWDITGETGALTSAIVAVGVSVANVGPTIQISHPIIASINSLAVGTMGIATVYGEVNILGESPTQTDIVLRSNNSNHTPVSNDAFKITLRKILWQFGQSIIDIGTIRLSPTLDFKDISTSNNFWLLGNHWATK